MSCGDSRKLPGRWMRGKSLVLRRLTAPASKTGTRGPYDPGLKGAGGSPPLGSQVLGTGDLPAFRVSQLLPLTHAELIVAKPPRAVGGGAGRSGATGLLLPPYPPPVSAGWANAPWRGWGVGLPLCPEGTPTRSPNERAFYSDCAFPWFLRPAPSGRGCRSAMRESRPPRRGPRCQEPALVSKETRLAVLGDVVTTCPARTRGLATWACGGLSWAGAYAKAQGLREAGQA